MDEKQLAAVTRLAQQQQEQIKMLVNLLLALLNEEPGEHNAAARNSAENILFIRTKLYEYIDVEGDAERERLAMIASEMAKAKALKQEERLNELKRQFIDMQLRQYE